MDDEKVIHLTNNVVENKHGRPLISFIRKVCDAREDVLLVHETRNRFGTIDTSHNTILQIKVYRHYDVLGISVYSICFTLWCIKYDNSPYPYRPFTDYIRNIPYMPQTILDKIKEIQLQDSDVGRFIREPESYSRRRIIWNDMGEYLQMIKTTIQDNLNEDTIVKHLKKLDIVNEINDLRSENKELYNKISMLQTLIKDKDEKTKTDIQQLQQEIKSVRIKLIDMLKTQDLRNQIDILTKKTN
jgi:hypothetical protein